MVPILCFMFAFSGCATTPGGKLKTTPAPVVGFVDTSVFLKGQLGEILFSRRTPQPELLDAHTDLQGYFWSTLPSGTYRIESVVVNDSSGGKVAEWVSPSEGKDIVEFEVAGHGTVVFVGSFKFFPAWKETQASAGATTILSLGNTAGIDRVEKPTEKEVLSCFLKNPTDQDSSERDAIRLRLKEIDGQAGSN